MSETPPGWTDERTDDLKRLWKDGVSASQIARQLGGVTRHACIGKIHRLGLAARASPSRPTKAPKIRPPPVMRHARLPVHFAFPGTVLTPEPKSPYIAPGAAFSPLAGSDPKPWTQRGSNQCTWPVGERDGEALSCCLKVKARGWCKAHLKHGLQPSGVKKRVDIRLGIETLAGAA